MTHQHHPSSANWERRVGLALACIVVLAFLFYIFVPPVSGDASIPIIRFLAAMTASLSAYLFIGSLDVGGQVRGSYVRATGGFAAFLIVFFLFLYGIPSDVQDESQTPSIPLEQQEGANPTEDVTIASLSKSTSTSEELIADFRASLEKWYGKLSKQEKEGERVPFMSRAEKADLSEIVAQLTDATTLSGIEGVKKARAVFYPQYWEDFKTRVLERELSLDSSRRSCRVASSIYRDPIFEYLRYGSSGGRISSKEDFLIVIELGHWLINRDAGAEDYPIAGNNSDYANGYKTSLDLYDLLETQSVSSDLKYNFFASRGIAKAKQRFYGDAREDFLLALRIDEQSPELHYNLASMEAQLANYQMAIDEYSKALERLGSDSEISSDTIYRDIAFSYLLSGIDKEKRRAGTGVNDLTNAINNFGQIKHDADMREIAHAGKALAIHYQRGSYEGDLPVDGELQKAGRRDISDHVRQIVGGSINDNGGLINIVKRVAFGNLVPHDLVADPVLDMFHGYFYCAGDSPRIS